MGPAKEDDEGPDHVSRLPAFEPLQKFLAKLSFKIEHALQPLPHRLESTEKAIAILMSCERHMQKDCFWWYMAQIELCRAKRLLAAQKGQLREVWGAVARTEESE